MRILGPKPPRMWNVPTSSVSTDGVQCDAWEATPSNHTAAACKALPREVKKWYQAHRIDCLAIDEPHVSLMISCGRSGKVYLQNHGLCEYPSKADYLLRLRPSSVDVVSIVSQVAGVDSNSNSTIQPIKENANTMSKFHRYEAPHLIQAREAREQSSLGGASGSGSGAKSVVGDAITDALAAAQAAAAQAAGAAAATPSAGQGAPAMGTSVSPVFPAIDLVSAYAAYYGIPPVGSTAPANSAPPAQGTPVPGFPGLFLPAFPGVPGSGSAGPTGLPPGAPPQAVPGFQVPGNPGAYIPALTGLFGSMVPAGFPGTVPATPGTTTPAPTVPGPQTVIVAQPATATAVPADNSKLYLGLGIAGAAALAWYLYSKKGKKGSSKSKSKKS